MAVRLEMTRENASGTEQGVTGPALPSPRKPRRFAPGLVTRRPRSTPEATEPNAADAYVAAGPSDDRRLTSRYVARL